MREVRDEKIRDEIYEVLNELLKPKRLFDIYIWDKSILQDDQKLKLFVVDYKDISGNEEHNKRLFSNIIEKSDGNIRSYQNTLVLLAPDYYGIDNLKLAAKRAIACEKAKKDEKIRLDKDEEKKAKSRLEEFKGLLKQQCINTYSKVVYPYSYDIRIDTLSFFDLKKGNLIDAIIELLKKKGKLVESINPEVIADKVDKVPVKRISEEFSRNRSEKFIAYHSKILDAIREGVAKGLFGYADRLDEVNGKYGAVINKDIDINAISLEGWLISKDLIYEEPIIEDKGSMNEPIKHKRDTYMPTIEVKHKNRYSIRLESIDDAIKVLPIINIVTVGINSDKSLHAELSNDNGDMIKIDSKLKNVEEIKSILNQLKYRYNGSANIEIIADEDISNEFEKYKIRYERV